MHVVVVVVVVVVVAVDDFTWFGELDNCFCARRIEVISNMFDRCALQHDSFAGG